MKKKVGTRSKIKPLRGEAFLAWLKMAARTAESWPKWMRGDKQWHGSSDRFN